MARLTAAGEDAAPGERSLPRDYAWLLVVAFLFGLANAISHGRWQPFAFALLVVALGVLAWRFFVAARPRAAIADAAGTERVLWVVFALLASMPITGLVDPKILAQPARSLAIVRATELASLALVASYAPFLVAGRVEPERLRAARFVAFAIVFLVAGVSVIQISPAPGIDVWTIQMRGGEVLLEGKNPYVWASVPDTDPENDFTVPFVYPPTAAYAAAIGVALFRDVRYVLLGAMFVAGLALRFIARRAPARGARPLPALAEDAPALFFWLTPMLLMVVELSWLDPLQVALIALGVAAFVADRRTLAAALLGFALSSKQSMFWLFPLAGIILRFDLARWAVMCVAALVPVLPFLAWDFAAIERATFSFMSGLPPRRDALCFTNAVFKLWGASFPPASGFLLAAAAALVACRRAWRRARDGRAGDALPSLDLSRALVLTYFVFFFFNRWAFANYYFLLTGLASLAAAAALHERARAAPAAAPGEDGGEVARRIASSREGGQVLAARQ